MTITVVMFKGRQYADIMRNNCKNDGKVEKLVRGPYDIEAAWVPFLRNATCTASGGRDKNEEHGAKDEEYRSDFVRVNQCQ